MESFYFVPSMAKALLGFFIVEDFLMELGFALLFNSILLGAGLAMDAFSVSLANGLNDPGMRKGRMSAIAGIFAGFQFAMPLIGWICVSTIAHKFALFEKCIPYIALALLGYIGGKMLIEGIKCTDEVCEKTELTLSALIVQGIATSIDALSVGFTIANYNFIEALISCLIIGVVTFFICFAGLAIGKKVGTRLAGKAGILGGSILIFIGIEIFLTGILG